MPHSMEIHFSEIDLSEWEVIDVTKGESDERNQHEHTYYVYERKHNKSERL